MVDIKDGQQSGARVDILQIANSICVVSSPATSASHKTATGSCIEIFGFYCLLTNAHVIPNAEAARKTTCYFGFVPGAASVKVKLNPALIFWSSPQEELDCVIVALHAQSDLPASVCALTPDTKPLSVGEYIQVWGHPNIDGRPFQQSTGAVTKLSSSTVHYRANTLDGFSGSPVTSIETGLLVALHCGGPTASHPQAGNTGSSIVSIMAAFDAEFSVARIMGSPAMPPSALLSPSNSSADLIAFGETHRRLLQRENSAQPVVVESAQAVPSYIVPVADNVAPVSVSEVRTVGFAVASVEEASSMSTGDFSTSCDPLDCSSSWCELAATTVVGLVPVLGPLANSVYHAHKGQYLSAVVDMFCAGVDVFTIACASSGGSAEGAAASTKIVLKESGEALGDMCAKKLLIGARKLLFNEQGVKQVLKKSSAAVAKRSTGRILMKSAAIKTTTSALSSATNALSKKGALCCSSVATRQNGDLSVLDAEQQEEEEDEWVESEEVPDMDDVVEEGSLLFKVCE